MASHTKHTDYMKGHVEYNQFGERYIPGAFKKDKTPVVFYSVMFIIAFIATVILIMHYSG